MRNWLTTIFTKESRRRFPDGSLVRFFISPRRGKNNVVLTPDFQRGKVLSYDKTKNRYSVLSLDNQVHEIHPRNLVAEK